MSPIYNNNPCYGLMTATAEEKIGDLILHFIQLEDFMRTGVWTKIQYDPQSVLGIDINDGPGIRQMW